MTCVDLMDIYEIEQETMEEFGNNKRLATNKLSDALGFMWRRGLLTRFPAGGEKGGMARYAYVWSEQVESQPVKSVPPPVHSTKMSMTE